MKKFVAESLRSSNQMPGEFTSSQRGYPFEYARFLADEEGYAPGRWPGGRGPRNLLYAARSWISELNPSFRAEGTDMDAYQGLCRLNAGCISRLMPRSIAGRQRFGQRLRPKQCRSGRIVRTDFNGGFKLSYHTGIRQKSAVHFGGVGRSMMLEWSSLRVVVMEVEVGQVFLAGH